MDMSLPDPAISPSPQRSWWQRNWKWAVPLGSVSALAVIALFVAAVAALVFTTIRREDLYREAVARAKASPAVQAELGSPVHEGWWMLGRLRTRGSWGIARFSVPLKGTAKNGTLYVWANKSAERWTYERLEVAVEGRPGRISLLVGEPPW
jgi:hypothetical protein